MNRDSARLTRISRDSVYPELKQTIISATGLEFYVRRDNNLADKISVRLEQLELADCAAYLQILKEQGEAELDELIKQLTIGETHFFRNEEMFAALRNRVFPDLRQRNAVTRRLRIWSAGCSTGAEAYSLSILLRRELVDLFHNWEISILGTDINRDFLSQAEEGRYSDWALRCTPDEIRESCFRREQKSWVIHPEYQRGVSFQYHNLVRHEFPSVVHRIYDFDLILCRNVLIYFGEAVTRTITLQLRDCLADGSWLLFGHADHISPSEGLVRTHDSGIALFQRRKRQLRLAATGVEQPTILAYTQAQEKPRQPCEPFAEHAARDYARCSPLQPQAPFDSRGCASLDRARTLADQGHVDAALRICSRELEKHQLDPAAHFLQALLHDQTGNRDRATNALRSTLNLARDHAIAHYYLGSVLREQGFRDSARRSFENVLSVLAERRETEQVRDGDGIRVAELRDLARTQLSSCEADA